MANPLGRSMMGVSSVGMALFTLVVLVIMLYGLSQWSVTRQLAGLDRGQLPFAA